MEKAGENYHSSLSGFSAAPKVIIHQLIYKYKKNYIKLK